MLNEPIRFKEIVFVITTHEYLLLHFKLVMLIFLQFLVGLEGKYKIGIWNGIVQKKRRNGLHLYSGTIQPRWKFSWSVSRKCGKEEVTMDAFAREEQVLIVTVAGAEEEKEVEVAKVSQTLLLKYFL